MPHSTRNTVALSLWLLLALFTHGGQAVAQTIASYAGTYAGAYSGGDSGSFSATISSTGGISVSGTGGSGAFTGSGSVTSSGSLQMTVGSVSTGSTFTGTINATTGALSGTWVNSTAGVNGSFSGTRTSSATTTTTAATTTTTTVATTTTTTLAGGVPLNLQAGWNLLGNGSAATIDVASTFGDPAKVTTVWKWVRTTSKWALYTPSLTSSALATYAQTNGYDVLTSLAPKDGFWVNAKAAATLSGPAGAAVTLSQADLQQGWNLVSSADSKTPSQLNQALSSSLAASGKTLATAWGWDATKSSWRFYASALEAQGGTVLADYIAGKSYLAFAIPPTSAEGFWVNVGAATSVSPATPPVFTTIATGTHTGLAIAANGDLWGWGNNGHGELADGTKLDSLKAKLLGSGYASVSMSGGGESYALAVKADGTLQSWGADIFKTGAADVLTPQTLGTGFASVSSGTYVQAAIKSDGSLWTWGQNTSDGLAGDGATLPIAAPKQVGTGFASVSMGTTHAMAVKQDGTLWAWGTGTCGAMGPGSTPTFASIKVPTQIGAGYKAAITNSINSTIALKTDGTLWSWGQTANGRLGDGVSVAGCRATPLQIGSGFVAIAGGYSSAIGLKSDGSLWSWGHLSISDSNTGADSLVPKQVGTGFTKIFMHSWRAFAIAVDGGLWSWGDSHDSGFANTFTYSPVPVKIN